MYEVNVSITSEGGMSGVLQDTERNRLECALDT